MKYKFLTDVQLKKIIKWLDSQIKAMENGSCKITSYVQLSNLSVSNYTEQRLIHVTNETIYAISQALDSDITFTDWVGNANCETDWIEGTISYKGWKIFALFSKGEYEDYESNRES